MRFHLKSIVAVFALMLAASPMAGAVDLISNGGFEMNSGVGQLVGTSVTNWSSSSGFPYNFLIDGNADSTGFTASTGGTPSQLHLSGPLSTPSSNNGFGTSPDGGYFFGAQVGFQVGSLSQTVGGLTAGNSYELNFYWAEANLTGNSASTTSAWSISFGSDTANTVGTLVASNGFNGWLTYTQTFTATSASQTLSFSPTGSGTGGFALLDGVSLHEVTIPVPEPSTYALAAIATGVMAALARRRKG